MRIAPTTIQMVPGIGIFAAIRQYNAAPCFDAGGVSCASHNMMRINQIWGLCVGEREACEEDRRARVLDASMMEGCVRNSA